MNSVQKSKFKKLMMQYKNVYIFLIPAVIYFVVIRYAPLYFVQIAFRDYRVTRPLSQSEWVGFKYFIKMFKTPGFINAFKNTFTIGFLKIVFGFPLPIIVALMLNEIRHRKYKSFAQTALYLPHFLSWTILGGIIYNLLSINGGAVNNLIGMLGVDPIFFMGKKEYFKGILVLSDIWKTTGWGTILYLSALTTIDPVLYESATVDGASRWRQLIHITLPGIKSTIFVLLIIKIGNVLDTGAEEILVMSNAMVTQAADVIDTFVFRYGLQQGNYSLATAAGLTKAVIAAVLVLGADKLSKKLGEKGVF